MVALEALLAGLAGWRIASLFVQESGPFDVFERIRQRFGIDIGAGIYGPGFIAGLLGCVWCLSVWTATAMFVLAHWGPLWPVALVAATAVAVGWHEHVERGH